MLGLAALVLLGAVRSGWMCDDAFITLRTVDNFVHGFGLTWNVDERVQAYSHPLWMFLLSALYAVTREPFYTTLAASLGLTACFLVLFLRWHAGRVLPAALALGALAVSKSFADYSTSGLENPLTHLLLCVALWLHLEGPATPRRIWILSLVTALGALNRIDALLLFLPLLAASSGRVARDSGARRIWGPLLLGALPLVAWELFSLFYYGSLVPNTALAKLGTGIPLGENLARGLTYTRISALVDPVPLVMVLAALIGAVRQRRRDLAPAIVGIGLHLLYVLRIGGDFMVGRHFAAPLVVAAILLARLRVTRASALSLGTLWVLCALLPYSPVRTGSVYVGPRQLLWFPLHSPLSEGVADERAFYHRYLGLWNVGERERSVAAPWAEGGRTVRRGIEEQGLTHLVKERGTIGLYGYFAGPKALIIDWFGLADPLLARLPVEDPKSCRIGHFRRTIPPGYRGTRSSGRIVLEDPDLAAFYAQLRVVITGELWSLARLRAIWALNTGGFEPRLAAYAARAGG
ncbi:MAG: hypothetical protein ABL998_02035 [Planctomycetota bacterium]